MTSAMDGGGDRVAWRGGLPAKAMMTAMENEA